MVISYLSRKCDSKSVCQLKKDDVSKVYISSEKGINSYVPESNDNV